MNLRRTTDRKIQSTFSSGFLLALLLLAGCGRQQVIPIFLWHSVGEGQPGDKYDLTPEEFEGQLKMLQERGIQTVTLDQYFDHLDGRSSLPEKAVVLSFDDGRKCQHSVVMPLLLKYGLVAETFLVNSYLGESNETRVVRNDAGRNETFPYAGWSTKSSTLASTFAAGPAFRSISSPTRTVPSDITP